MKHAITIEQILYLRNKLPEIVKQFNEEDRNKFNVTVDNFLESLKANYK